MSTPVSAAIAVSAVLLGVPVMLAATTSVAAATAAAAADTAALAAADELVGYISASPGGPCNTAAEVVRTHRANLKSCEIDETTLEVRVVVTVTTGVIPVSRKARAGPLP